MASPEIEMQILWTERQGYKSKKVKAKYIQDVRSTVLAYLLGVFVWRQRVVLISLLLFCSSSFETVSLNISSWSRTLYINQDSFDRAVMPPLPKCQGCRYVLLHPASD